MFICVVIVVRAGEIRLLEVVEDADGVSVEVDGVEEEGDDEEDDVVVDGVEEEVDVSAVVFDDDGDVVSDDEDVKGEDWIRVDGCGRRRR